MMKKKICCCAAALLLIFSATASYADEPVEAEQPVRKEQPAKADIKLSLAEAVKIMQTTGARAQTAELNKKADQAIAEGYTETIQTINETLRTLDFLNSAAPSLASSASWEAQNAGATKANRAVLRLRRDFAKQQMEPNYKSEMNQIEYDT
mgnify:CR=1 FL=1